MQSCLVFRQRQRLRVIQYSSVRSGLLSIPGVCQQQQPGLCSCGGLSSPKVCSRCSKAAREHLGAHQGESPSVLPAVSLGRAGDRQPSHSLLGESEGQRENYNGEKREREVGKMRRESDERAALQKMRLLSPSLGTLQEPHFRFKLEGEGNAFHLSKDD